MYCCILEKSITPVLSRDFKKRLEGLYEEALQQHCHLVVALWDDFSDEGVSDQSLEAEGGQAAALCPSAAVPASPSPCSGRTSYTPAHALLPRRPKATVGGCCHLQA